MGYHVAIVRTGQNRPAITQAEIEPVAERLGYTVERDEAGSIRQMSRKESEEEIALFYDDNQLWASNPSEVTMAAMLEFCHSLGQGARVRGDEGETYQTVSETYHHPDDARDIMKAGFDWKYWASLALPVIAGSCFLYVFGRMALRHFHGS